MTDLSRRAILGAAALLAGCEAPAPAEPVNEISVIAALGSTSGKLAFQGHSFDCMLGRSGILRDKHEGDGGTPAGVFSLREVRYRADRFAAPPATRLAVARTMPNDGWCDDPHDPNYNRPITRPYPASSEEMWRADDAYDVLAVIGYNDAPPVPGAGSAIFLHVMRQEDGHGLPTAGCVSLVRADLLAVLALCGPQTAIRISTL